LHLRSIHFINMSHRYYRYAFSMSQLYNAYANDSKSCKLSEVLLKRIQQRGTRYRIPEVERWWNKPLSHEARRNITRSNVISSNVVQWNVIATAVYHLISHAARYYVASARKPSCESKSFRAFWIFFLFVFTFLLRIFYGDRKYPFKLRT